MLLDAITERRIGSLHHLLETAPRIAIVGGPRTGKTTLANMHVGDRPVVATDSLMHLDWADVPLVLIERCSPLSRFVIEGVQAARALRKGLVVDAVLCLDAPMVDRTSRQVSMAKAVETVFVEWRASDPDTKVLRPDVGNFC